jgi:hypothetical protein
VSEREKEKNKGPQTEKNHHHHHNNNNISPLSLASLALALAGELIAEYKNKRLYNRLCSYYIVVHIYNQQIISRDNNFWRFFFFLFSLGILCFSSLTDR